MMLGRKLPPCGVALSHVRSSAGLLSSASRCVLVASPPLTTARRALSSEVTVDEGVQWARDMEAKYGPGNYQYFRPLYKDLCDEIRREYYTKPPPPPQPPAATSVFRRRLPPQDDVQEPAAEEGRAGQVEEPQDGASSPGSSLPAGDSAGASATATPPPEVYGDGSWSVAYVPEHNVVTFRRAAVKEGRLAEVCAWSRIEMKDPARLNAVLTFADWIPIEVCVVRNGVVIHFSMASNEGGMHMRNVRVYEPQTPEEKAALLDPSDDGEQARKRLYYDGPCLWHLELDFQNELYDVMQDHGITLDWVYWATSWVFYLEHVNYVKWNLGMLEELIPSPVRDDEGDFLMPEEKALLEEPVEDWLEAHSK